MKNLKYMEFDVSLERYTYENKRLCVYLTLINGDGYEPFGSITVNLPHASLSNRNCGFVDTNNFRGIEEFLVKYNLAKPTYRGAASGFCLYPEYEFNLEEIKKYI